GRCGDRYLDWVESPLLNRGLPARIGPNNALRETIVDASRLGSLYSGNRLPGLDLIVCDVHYAFDRLVVLGVVTHDLHTPHDGIAGFEREHGVFRGFLKTNEAVGDVTRTLAFPLEQTDRRLNLVLVKRIERMRSRRFGWRRAGRCLACRS